MIFVKCKNVIMKRIFTLCFAFFLLANASECQSSLDSGLVAYYPFNGNDSDYSIFGNHPAFNNATLTSDRFGNENSSYKFNGMNTYIRIPNSPSINFNSTISLCSWIKVSGFYYGTCHGNYVIKKGDNDNVQGSYSTTFTDVYYTNGANCSRPIPDTIQQTFGCFTADTSHKIQKERWYFVVGTYDGSFAKIYIDGRLQNVTYLPNQSYTNTHDLFFGKLNNIQYPYWFNGSLDDVRIYNRALTREEVRKLYTEQPSATITGNVFVDNNANGIKDSLDYESSYTKIKLSNGDYVFTDYNGDYAAYIDSVGKYTISLDTTISYQPSPAIDSVNITSIDTSITKNFRMLLNNTPFDSVFVNIIPLMNAARPGFAYPCVINYVNTGNTILNVSNNFIFDTTILQYDSSSNISTIRNWNVISTNTNQMHPGQRNVFIAYFTVKATAHLGDSVKLYTTAYANSATSYDSVFARIRGSYDPNDKEATPLLTTTDVANGKYIDYVVRFENTGTDTAFKVLVTDELSTLLDLNSLQITGLSHPCNISVNDNKISFTFNKIYLPYTGINSIASHGYIAFKIKPKNTVTDGTDIPNKASIYFDYNLPIVTNTAVTKIRNPIITPLKITNFSIALINDENVKNIWSTANEVNVNHFLVQRSFNGINFNTIGEVSAKNRLINDYNFIDKISNITVKNIYYRIIAVDNDGKTQYSETRHLITNNKIKSISVFPNPSSKKINIVKANAEKESLLLTDIHGKVIASLIISGAYASIDISNLANGVYILHFENGENIKFVKQ